MGRRLQDFEEGFTSQVKKKERKKKVGLAINEKNTKFKVISQMSYSGNEYLTLGIYNFEIVKDYACIGKLLTHKNELNQRLKK